MKAEAKNRVPKTAEYNPLNSFDIRIYKVKYKIRDTI